MEPLKKNGPAGAGNSGAGQGSCATDNPLLRAWLRQTKSVGGSPPARLGRPGRAFFERQARLLADRDKNQAIRCRSVFSHGDIAALVANMRAGYQALTLTGWFLPPTILEGGEVLPWTTPQPYEASPAEEHELLASYDSVRFASPEEERWFREAYIARLQEWMTYFTPHVFEWLIYHYRLGDERNLLNSLCGIQENFGWLRVGDEKKAREVAGQVDAILKEADRLAIDDGVLAWYAGRDSDGDTEYWRDFERFGRELRAVEDERMRKLRGREDDERAFLDGLDWSDDDSPPPAASPAGDDDGPAPAGQPAAGATAALPPSPGQRVTVAAVAPVEQNGPSGQAPFPTDALPPLLADYCRRVAQANVVDESLVGLAMLAVAGAAMGNAWRLELKNEFAVPPLLWVAVVSRSGSNKTAPLNAVVKALQKPTPITAVENPMLNPQGRAVVSNATVEAVIARLAENPRGLLCYCNELAGWVKGFGQYKKGGGGDEQAWLEFWDAHGYQLDRKTNNEQVFIPAASVSVLGGIQPLIFARCFDPDKFASGLIPRLLLTMPDYRQIRWVESAISEQAQAIWTEAVQWLRTRPFAGLDPDTGRYRPHMLTLPPDAKAAYIEFYNAAEGLIAGTGSEHADAFASKARSNAGRLALILHGMDLAAGCRQMASQVGTQAVVGGVQIARWCLAEQLRVFGLSSQRFVGRREDEVVAWMRTRGGRATVRELHRTHGKRYQNAEQAKADLDRLVVSGKARWEGKECVLLE